MPELISQRKKLTFFILLLLCGIGGLGAFFAVLVSRYDPTSEKSILEWLVLPEVILSVITLTLITWFSFSRVNRKISTLINETMDTLANGILHFNDKGMLDRFNPAAALLLPELYCEESEAGFIGTYKKFLAFVYDHSLDIQDQSRLTRDIEQIDEVTSRLLFREVIELSNRKVIMVQFYQRSSSEIIAIMTDISMMKRHIDEVAVLTEENMIMIKAIEAAGDGMVIAQSDGVSEEIIFSNQIFAEMMGMKLETIHNSSLYEVLDSAFEDQIDTIHSAIQAVRKGGVQNVWLKKRQDKKEVLWYGLYVIFFVDTNDKEYFVCFLSNQTEAKLLQAKTYQAQKLEAISQLAGGIAHDFNNILSVIDGYAKLAERGFEHSKDVSGFLEQIHRGVKRGSEITSRLLTFGQCRVTQKSRLDICERVRDLEAFLAPMMPASVNMILSVQEDPCYIEASPDAITQIVMNLAANSRDAMPDGGDLIISVAEASRSQLLSLSEAVDPMTSYVCIQVIDSGVGIDPEIWGRIYEPFFTSKDPAKNPGLGLSLVYGLVKEIEAIIDIKSTVGVGTSVSIAIPLCEAPKRSMVTDPAIKSDGNGNLRGKTILVVEDSPEVLDMQGKFLEDMGLTVFKAASGDEAMLFEENYKNKIDFLLSDVVLPEMNGVQLGDLFSLKRPETKIILVSAYPALATVDGDARASGFTDDLVILAKPLIYEHLAEVLTAHVKNNPPHLEQLKVKPHWSHKEKIM